MEWGPPDERIRRMDPARLEMLASGITSYAGGSNLNPQDVGAARAELARRNRIETEEKEESRRKFETDLLTDRKDFETALAEQQMKHASALANEQLGAAQSAASAAKWAAVAGFAAAFAAVAQAVIAAVR